MTTISESIVLFKTKLSRNNFQKITRYSCVRHDVGVLKAELCDVTMSGKEAL